MCETRLYLRGGKPGSLGESCFSPCLDLSECIFPLAARVRRPCTFSHTHTRIYTCTCIASTNYGHSISAFDRFTSQRRDKKARPPSPCFHPVSTPSTPPSPLRARDVETQLIPFESERNRRDAINRGVASEEAVV